MSGVLLVFFLRNLPCKFLQESQQLKVVCKHPIGLLHPIPIPKQKWEVISMDFITGLPTTSMGHDIIVVVVDKLSKVAHFVAVKSTISASEVA